MELTKGNLKYSFDYDTQYETLKISAYDSASGLSFSTTISGNLINNSRDCDFKYVIAPVMLFKLVNDQLNDEQDKNITVIFQKGFDHINPVIIKIVMKSPFGTNKSDSIMIILEKSGKTMTDKQKKMLNDLKKSVGGYIRLYKFCSDNIDVIEVYNSVNIFRNTVNIVDEINEIEAC